LPRQKRAVIRGKNHRPRAPKRRREDGRPGSQMKDESLVPLLRSQKRSRVAEARPRTSTQQHPQNTQHTQTQQTPGPRPPCNRTPLPKGGERETSWSNRTTNVVAERCRKTN
jgi:hypothetical protein